MQPAAKVRPSGQRARSARSSRPRSPPAKRRRTIFPEPDVTSPRSPASTSPPPSPSVSPCRSPSSTPRSNSQSPPRVHQPPPASAKWFRKPSVVWYRGNDLRVEDHPALLAAAQRGGPVIPFFVWDASDGFGKDLGPVKQWWLCESLKRLQTDLRRLGVQLYTRSGRSTDELRNFLEETGADAVFWNRCYEPDLLQRDEELREQLAHEGLTAESFKAELLVEPWELSNTDVSPCFDTFHSYMRAWMTVPPPPQPFPCPSRLLPITREIKCTKLEHLGFVIPENTQRSMKRIWKPGSAEAKIQLEKFLYEVFPAFGEGRCRRHFDGTSRLSPHIRFGELSPRRMYHATRLRVSQWDQTNTYGSAHHGGTFSKRSPTKRPRVGRNRAVASPLDGPEDKAWEATRTRGIGQDASTAKNGYSARKKGDRREVPYAVEEEKDRGEIDKERMTAQVREGRVPHARKRPKLPHISLSARAFLKNLCLRDFSYHVLFHNPDFSTTPLVSQFRRFPWAEDKGSFIAWRNGTTGYPIVDAAMRELRETGWVHNGMRFLLACFLTKYLLLPWSRGLKEFYHLLVDGDHSSNALGWQWTAGSNTDAFPFSCLVNPVKVAYLHDPSGSYVRKWIPELAELPTEFIHQPWKASGRLMKRHGINLGTTYPNRVVLMADARNRAMNAMSFMKQIFAGSQVMRNLFDSKDMKGIRDWPETHPEPFRVDETPSFAGKGSLLPSLWALLQCDQTSAYLSGTASGNDPLIAMDTASLVEGTLAVPLDENQDSIEHALITAHEQGASDPTFCTVGLSLSGRGDHSSFHSGSESGAELELREDGEGAPLDISPLEGSLKYTSSELNGFSSSEKPTAPQSSGPQRIEDQYENGARGDSRPQELSSSHFPTPHAPFAVSSQQPAFPSAGAQYSHAPLPNLQQLQQLQQFQQLQALGMQRVQQQQITTGAVEPQLHRGPLQRPGQGPPHVSRTPVSHGQIPTSRQGNGQVVAGNAQLGASIQQLSQGQVPPQSFRNALPNQMSQALKERHPTHALNVTDGMYNHQRVGSNGVDGGILPQVPITATSMLGGPAAAIPNGTEHSMAQNFASADHGSGHYSTHLGMNQFYGYQPMMAMLNSSPFNGTDRFDAVNGVGAGTPQKSSIAGGMPVGYGPYGGVFDPCTMGNAFTPGAASYAGVSSALQSQSHPSHQTPYGLAAQHMYYPTSVSADAFHNGASGGIPRGSPPPPFSNGHFGGNDGLPKGNAVPAPAPRSNGVVNETPSARTLAEKGSLEVSLHGRPGNCNVRRATDATRPELQKSTPEASLSTRPARSAGSASLTAKGQAGRGATKQSSRSRGSSRSKRGGKGHVLGNKSSAENRGQGGSRGKPGDQASQKTNVGDGRAATTSLKSRKDMLGSVLASEEHAYHSFAKFLSVTYELTGNTDRQTSRDYVRLCNLKDEYHRQYPSEKDTLKIYRMKRFFSDCLKLEVTGEWDRHNHGGVRGPYVYGIRARTQVESSAGNAPG